MIYDEYLTQAELQRWILDADVSWPDIDATLAHSQPDVLDQVRDSALIESYFPVYTTKLMRAFWDQLDVTSVFSVQLYESYKHFYVLNRYLEAVGANPIADEELVDVRRRNLNTVIDDPVHELARYMISEHFAAYFFLRLSRRSAEPVLAQIAGHIARDKFRHTQFAFDLLDVRLKQDASLRDRVLEAGRDFRHVGADVMSRVPVSQKNDLAAILTLNKRLRRLCGVSLSEFTKGTVHGSN